MASLFQVAIPFCFF